MTDIDPDQPQQPGMGLIVPFTACASQGGPFDDEAFINGVDCGVLHAEMRMLGTVGATPLARWVKPGILDQLDLIAMANRYVMKRGETDEASGCVWCSFSPAGCVHGVVADD